MSSEKNLLKKLLLNLLDGRLKRLEKRNVEEIKDLDHVKVEIIYNDKTIDTFTHDVDKNKISFLK